MPKPLFWPAAPAPDQSALASVKFATPVSGYSTVAGAIVGTSNESGANYHAFANVTAQVQGAGPGTYGVANVQAGRGGNGGTLEGGAGGAVSGATIGTQDGYLSVIAGAGGNIQDAGAFAVFEQPDGFFSPAPVDSQAEHPVEEVVTRGNAAEHLLDFLTFFRKSEHGLCYLLCQFSVI